MAIPDILKYVAIEFDHYLEIRNDQPRGRFGYVNLGNIALVDEGSSGMGGEQDKVTMTLINIEEEATLKNRPNYQRMEDDSIQRQEPPLFLNAYILMSCPSDTYETALTHISYLLEFYQRQRMMTPVNAVEGDFPTQHVEKIILELVSLNLEQINHLWGVLGSRHYPAVMFKLKLVPIQASKQRSAERVETVSASGRVKRGPEDDGSGDNSNSDAG